MRSVNRMRVNEVSNILKLNKALRTLLKRNDPTSRQPLARTSNVLPILILVRTFRSILIRLTRLNMRGEAPLKKGTSLF